MFIVRQVGSGRGQELGPGSGLGLGLGLASGLGLGPTSNEQTFGRRNEEEAAEFLKQVLQICRSPSSFTSNVGLLT